MGREEVMRCLEATRVVAIIRGVPAEACPRVAEACADGGIGLVEVAFDRSGDPRDVARAISAIRCAIGKDMRVGAGTVLTEEQLRAAVDAGGEFMVTPSVNPRLIARASAAGLVTMPGAFTPSEIVSAREAGADVVKVFPVRSLGVQYVRDVLAPLGPVRLMAVGGVTPDNAADYLRAGCIGVGAGGSLVNPEWVRAGEFARIAETARRLIDSIEAVKVHTGPK